MKRASWFRLLAVPSVLLLFMPACLLFPDDTEKGEQVANQRPDVRITGGAATSDSAGVDYKVLFQWHGTDDDGLVSFFQFAVDDTVSEEAWTDTTGFSGLFRFPATTQDAQGDSIFRDWHTFYIRAIDNEFAVSRPDKRYFNARTIAPEARITFPDFRSIAIPNLFRTVVIQWDGEDLDSSRPDKKPVYYEYKLARIHEPIDPEPEILDSLRLGNNLLLDTVDVGSKAAWIRVPVTTRELKLNDLPSFSRLVFGVRAVDEAGAVEPSLERNVNYIAFTVRTETPQPFVTVSEPTLGSNKFPLEGEDGVWTVYAPSDRPLRFKWEGDASDYGSLPGNSNYALDIPDVEDENRRDPNGIGGWIGWGRWEGNIRPFVFPASDGAARHVLWVKMRDVSDAKASERICKVVINVVVFTQHKFAYVVDDARFPQAPNDATHDTFLKATMLKRLWDMGRPDEIATFGTTSANEPNAPQATEIRLDTFAQYQNLIWHVELGNNTQLTGLRLHEYRLGRISSFLGAGGRLFMFGGRIASFITGSRNTGNFIYPKTPPNNEDARNPEVGFEDDSWLWKFMHFRSWIVSIPYDASPEQQQASGLVAARSMHPTFPDLSLDHTKWNPSQVQDCSPRDSSLCHYKGGMPLWEGIKARSPVSIVREAGLDSLYRAKTFNTLYDWRTREPYSIVSNVDNAVMAMRYQSTPADTAAGTQQGRVLWMSFQPYYFLPNGVRDAGTAAINWVVSGRDY